MSLSATISKSLNVGGLSIPESRSLSGDAVLQQDKNLAAAKTGVLTVRTNNTDGSLTMTAGHGIATGNRLDLYWSGGCRRGIVVGTVATNVVPITGGSGDNLPSAAAAITAMVPTQITMALGADKIVLLAAYTAAARAQVVFMSSAPAELLSWTLGPGASASTDLGHERDWDSQNGSVSPLAGVAVATIYISHDDSSATRAVKVGALVNN